ncbi:MAG: type II toxin-antitoxin system death-on-curing family toxin [Pyrinomonadaceae bacterium]
MATDEFLYIEYPEAVALHFEIMFEFGETRIGIAEPNLIESALARPKHAAVYEDADIIRQAATLLFGLIKNHPWLGGNKRTATALTDSFLYRNGFDLIVSLNEIIKLSLNVEADVWKIDEIENWLRKKAVKI